MHNSTSLKASTDARKSEEITIYSQANWIFASLLTMVPNALVAMH